MRVPLAKPACLIALVAIGVMCSRQAEARFVMGIGAASCGKWSEPHTAGALEANYQWVVGFVSGANMFTENDIIDRPEVDYAALMAWMDNYCKAEDALLVRVGTLVLLRSLAQNVREGARDLARHIVVFGCWEAQRPLRRSVTPSRTCAHRKPSGDAVETLVTGLQRRCKLFGDIGSIGGLFGLI
jgi:hypothetical protein